MVKIESLILVWISPAATKLSPHLYAAHEQVVHSSRQFDSTQPQSASMILPKLAPTKNKNRFDLITTVMRCCLLKTFLPEHTPFFLPNVSLSKSQSHAILMHSLGVQYITSELSPGHSLLTAPFFSQSRVRIRVPSG